MFTLSMLNDSSAPPIRVVHCNGAGRRFGGSTSTSTRYQVLVPVSLHLVPGNKYRVLVLVLGVQVIILVCRHMNILKVLFY